MRGFAKESQQELHSMMESSEFRGKNGGLRLQQQRRDEGVVERPLGGTRQWTGRLDCEAKTLLEYCSSSQG